MSSNAASALEGSSTSNRTKEYRYTTNYEFRLIKVANKSEKLSRKRKTLAKFGLFQPSQMPITA
jgi:hypothetical protein